VSVRGVNKTNQLIKPKKKIKVRGKTKETDLKIRKITRSILVSVLKS
jgi:hypothetical protein